MTDTGEVHEITMENFESTVDSNLIVILDFWADWCGPCKAFAPVFEAAAHKHRDVFFGKVDTEKATDLASAFLVRSVPTVMAFKNGNLVFEAAGLIPPAAIDELIEKLRKLEIAPPDGTPPSSTPPDGTPDEES